MTLLQAERLTRTFGSLVAVDRVDLAVTGGEIRALIGPNGAGKTTLFHLLSGLLPPTGGQVFLRGREITRLPMTARVHLGLTRSFQVTSLFPNLTVWENVQLAVQTTRGLAPFWRDRGRSVYVREEVQRVLRLVGLDAIAELYPPQLSHGDQRRLEIALALAPRPGVLLLDEPTAGMSLGETVQMTGLIREVNRAEGVTVVIVEHDMQVIMDLAHRITVLNQGRVLADGTPAEIARAPEVQEAYLGRRGASGH